MNLLTHLGLGDHFITYGLVRELADRHDSILLFCKKINLQSLQCLYSGTNITPEPIEDETEAFTRMLDRPYDSLKIGFTSEQETEERFGESFYKQANMSYETRWKYMPFINCAQVQGQGNFVHLPESESMSARFQTAIQLTYNNSPNIFGYKDIIENAPEVHVMESSFRQMIEFLEPKGKLFLHFDKEKSWRIVPSRHKWEII